MTVQTRVEPILAQAFQTKVGELLERAVAAPAGADRSRLVRWLLVAAAVFVTWRMWRGAKQLFWTVFGIGMAIFWTGGFWWWPF